MECSHAVIDVVRTLGAHTAGGVPRYPQEDVEDLLGLVFLSYDPRVRGGALSPHVERLLGAFTLRAMIPPGATPEETAACIDRYLSRKPIQPELLDAVLDAVRTARVDMASAAGKVLGRFCGDQGARLTAFVRGATPDGAVAAGPLARFAAVKKFQDREPG